MSGCRRTWWVLTVRYGHTIRMNEIRHPSTLIPAAHGLSSLTLDAHRRFTLSLLKHTQRRRTFAARPVFAWRVGRTCLMSSERPDSGPLRSAISVPQRRLRWTRGEAEDARSTSTLCRERLRTAPTLIVPEYGNRERGPGRPGGRQGRAARPCHRTVTSVGKRLTFGIYGT